jgi:transcriptional regulator with XRE-family HTH domain
MFFHPSRQRRFKNLCYTVAKKYKEASRMRLGEKIKQLRGERGFSQGLLEQRSGVSAKLLSKYENGRIAPTAETLKKIAEALDISADYLIFDNVPKEGRCQLDDLELFEKFREVERMDVENKKMIVNLIDAVIIKTKVQQAIKPAQEQPWEDRMLQTLSKFRSRAKGYSEEEIMQMVDKAVETVRLEEKKAS